MIAKPTHSPRQGQRGVFLIEALLAILIFSLGILGMVAMGGAAVSAQSDAQYRTDADNFANALASQIELSVDRGLSTDSQTVKAQKIAASLGQYAYNTGGGNCAFTGPANALLTNWLAEVTAAGTGLPGATAQSVQVNVNTGQFNQVSITLCWQAPSDKAPRKHMLVTYVN